MTAKLMTEHHLEFLSLKGGWSECTLVKMSHCWKSHVTANNTAQIDKENPVAEATADDDRNLTEAEKQDELLNNLQLTNEDLKRKIAEMKHLVFDNYQDQWMRGLRSAKSGIMLSVPFMRMNTLLIRGQKFHLSARNYE